MKKLMIDSNTRYLQFKDGLYHNGGARLPCDSCAIHDVCTLRRERCDMMVPTISFANIEGTQSVFNTLRLGKAWSQRLAPGQIVGIHDLSTNEITGYADVLQLYCGNFEDMMKTHAHANHLMLGYDIETAQEQMTTWFRKQYGPSVVKEITKITAVYLLSRDSTSDEAHFQKLSEAWLTKGGAESSG